MATQAIERDISHIPPELVWNHSFDLYTAEGDDPFLAITRLHDQPPVFWATDAAFGRPGWVCTRCRGAAGKNDAANAEPVRRPS